MMYEIYYGSYSYSRRRERERRRKKRNRIILLIVLLLVFCIIFIIINNKRKTLTQETDMSIIEEQDILQEADNNIQSEINKSTTENKNIDEVNPSLPEKEIDSFTTDWDLILINKNNKIPYDYKVDLSNIGNGHMVDYRIAKSLQNMISDAKREGISPIICSSYRTNKEQTQLYNNKTNQYLDLGYNEERAKELASYWVTLPGTSEHEIGLAVDIISQTYQKLDTKQENTEVHKWLRENSYKYGFIVRYPPSKSQITMINYEPWHYRYVGPENAEYMKKNNICLEEYIDYLSQFEN